MFFILKQMGDGSHRVLHLLNKDVKFYWSESRYSHGYSYSRGAGSKSHDGRTKPYCWKTLKGAENFLKKNASQFKDLTSSPKIVGSADMGKYILC